MEVANECGESFKDKLVEKVKKTGFYKSFIQRRRLQESRADSY